MESQVLEYLQVSVCALRFIHIYIDKRQGRKLPLRLKLLFLSSFGLLGAVLGASLHTSVDALSIEGTADDVVTHTREVLDTAAADHDDGVLLQVMADTGDVRGNFIAIGQAHTGDLRSAEFGFLGVEVRTAVQTPLFWGALRSVSLFFRVFRPFCIAGEVDL